jgi:micrococcal nuclease
MKVMSLDHRIGGRATTVWARAAATVAALVVLAACSAAVERPADGPVAEGLPSGIDVVVDRVVDGDTVVVIGDRHIRLIGVDAPETKDPRRPVGCFGREASRFLTALLPRGTRVRLVGDVEQEDRYGRVLAYVYRLADGLFVNAELLRRGYAQVLTIPPNVAHSDEFVALAGEARLGQRGLWAACSGSSG